MGNSVIHGPWTFWPQTENCKNQDKKNQGLFLESKIWDTKFNTFFSLTSLTRSLIVFSEMEIDKKCPLVCFKVSVVSDLEIEWTQGTRTFKPLYTQQTINVLSQLTSPSHVFNWTNCISFSYHLDEVPDCRKVTLTLLWRHLIFHFPPPLQTIWVSV